LTPEFLLSAERHGNGGQVIASPEKQCGKIPQRGKNCHRKTLPPRSGSRPGTAGRPRPKRKRNVMPRRKRQVCTAGRPESPCGTHGTVPGERRSRPAAPAPATAYSPLDSAPACPDAGRDAGIWQRILILSVPESLIPAAPRRELLSSLKREAPLLMPSRALPPLPGSRTGFLWMPGPGPAPMQWPFL